MTRINKFLADCGVASRRGAEDLISLGVVNVNGKAVTGLSTQITDNDAVTVNGKPVTRQSEMVYIALNKPAGVVTTCDDQFDRPTVLDLLKDIKQRIYPVGRLDYDTEGLLILTNDGEFTKRITHPSSEIPKTYVATLHKSITPEQVKQLKTGVGFNSPKSIKADGITVEVTITEGRNRQVRKMFEAVGAYVIHLKRTQIGTLTLGNLKPGTFRYLTADEVKSFANSKKK